MRTSPTASATKPTKTTKTTKQAQRKADWKATLEKHGLELQDAKINFLIEVTAADTHGKPGEPAHCALARAWKRNGATDVYIGNKVAGVIRTLPSGQKVAERYVLPQNVVHAIYAFDKVKRMDVGGYAFMAPTGERTLAAQKANSRKASREWAKLSAGRKASILKARADRRAKRKHGLSAKSGKNVILFAPRHFGLAA